MSPSPRADLGQTFSRQRILLLVLIGMTGIVFYLCYRLTEPFIPALTWALALAVIGHPLHDWLCRRFHQESVVAALAVFVVTAILVLPVTLIVQQISQDAVSGISNIAGSVADGRWREALGRNPRVAAAFDWVQRQFNVAGQIKQMGEGGAGRAVEGIWKTAVFAVFSWLVTLLLLFYFFRDKQKLLQGLRSLVPLSTEETDKVFRRVRDSVQATIFGTVVVALVQGTLGGLMFWWLDLPAPLLWGSVMALLAIVPVFGAFIVWIPAAIFLALEGSTGKALILTAWGGILIALVDNLLYPILVKDRLRLHTVPVFIALVGGIAVFGAAGIVLGPVTLAVAVALVEIWRRRFADGPRAPPGDRELSGD